jgi:putative hydrolase of the HAD superfamily
MTHQFLIFDGDDTLWDTQPLYTKALDAFYRVMERQGFPRDSIEANFMQRNVDYVTEQGFGILYMGILMSRFYKEMCGKFGKFYDTGIADAVHQIGDAVYQTPVAPMQWAKACLRTLVNDNLLILYSAGHQATQRRKARETDTEHYFDEIWITHRKDGDDLLRRLEAANVPLEDTIMIGNSLKSDVTPALNAGIKAIHFDNTTWAYEDRVPETPEGAIRITSLLDVRDAVETIRDLTWQKYEEAAKDTEFGRLIGQIRSNSTAA